MILSGGGVGLSGLYQYLKANLDLEIDRCNPFFQTDTEDESISKENMKLYGPSLTAAAGLALGQCDKINILPEKYRPSLKKTFAKLAPIAAVLLIDGFLFSYSSNVRQEVITKKAVLNEKKVALAELQIQAPELGRPARELKSLKQTIAELKKEKRSLPGATPFPFNFRDIYDELALLVQDNTSISEIYFAAQGSEAQEGREEDLTEKGNADISDRERIKITGHIFGSDLKAQNTLRFLLQDLKGSPVFQEIKLIRSKPLPEKTYNSLGIQFELYAFPKTLS